MIKKSILILCFVSLLSIPRMLISKQIDTSVMLLLKRDVEQNLISFNHSYVSYQGRSMHFVLPRYDDPTPDGYSIIILLYEIHQTRRVFCVGNRKEFWSPLVDDMERYLLDMIRRKKGKEFSENELISMKRYIKSFYKDRLRNFCKLNNLQLVEDPDVSPAFNREVTFKKDENINIDYLYIIDLTKLRLAQFYKKKLANPYRCRFNKKYNFLEGGYACSFQMKDGMMVDSFEIRIESDGEIWL